MDVAKLRVGFPQGATSATLVVTCRNGSAPPDRTLSSEPSVQIIEPTGCSPLSPLASAEVTFVGQGANGAGTIASDAVGSLGLHGRLNHLADQTDVVDKVDNCADVEVANNVNGAGAGSFITCAQLPVESPNLSVGGGKSTSQTEIPPDTPITFTLQSVNTGNLPIALLVMLDPVDPTAPRNPFVPLDHIDASVDPTSTAWSWRSTTRPPACTRPTSPRTLRC